MKMFRHDHISSNNEFVLHSDFFENLQKKIFATGGLQKLATVITTAGNEMEFTTAMKSPQSFGHGNNIVQASIIPTLRLATPAQRRMGHPPNGSGFELTGKGGPPVPRNTGSAKDGAPSEWKRF